MIPEFPFLSGGGIIRQYNFQLVGVVWLVGMRSPNVEGPRTHVSPQQATGGKGDFPICGLSSFRAPHLCGAQGKPHSHFLAFFLGRAGGVPKKGHIGIHVLEGEDKLMSDHGSFEHHTS